VRIQQKNKIKENILMKVTKRQKTLFSKPFAELNKVIPR